MRQTSKIALNKGMRAMKDSNQNNPRIYTYELKKIGLTPIYDKGVVFDDNIHISPLNV